MTLPWDTFEYITKGIDNDRHAWDGAFNEARQELKDERSVDIAEFGRRAWQRLTPVQRAYALDGLFAAYYRVITDEEAYDRLTEAAQTTDTVLHPDDLTSLTESLLHPQGEDELATVTNLASSVANVVDEVALLRRKLDMLTGGTG